jgi:hypothetical protein
MGRAPFSKIVFIPLKIPLPFLVDVAVVLKASRGG